LIYPHETAKSQNELDVFCFSTYFLILSSAILSDLSGKM